MGMNCGYLMISILFSKHKNALNGIILLIITPNIHLHAHHGGALLVFICDTYDCVILQINMSGITNMFIIDLKLWTTLLQEGKNVTQRLIWQPSIESFLNHVFRKKYTSKHSGGQSGQKSLKYFKYPIDQTKTKFLESRGVIKLLHKRMHVNMYTCIQTYPIYSNATCFILLRFSQRWAPVASVICWLYFIYLILQCNNFKYLTYITVM